MGEFSLTFRSGAVVIAVASALLALLTGRLPAFARWSAAVVLPFALAYGLYWVPIWSSGSHSDQAGSWAPICIVPWGLSGLLAAAAVTFLIWRYERSSS